jgi:opacity protein-like surface antigen
MRCAVVVGLVTLLSLSGPAVRSDTILTPFAGGAFGGATDRTRATYGASLSFLADGLLGFEVEFAFTPDFFGKGDPDPVLTKNNVVTMMGSLLLVAPGGSMRLYAAGGAGLLRTRLADADRLFDVDSNDFGINVGGGLIAYFGDHVGLRADIRYFRDLSDDQPGGGVDFELGSVDYWRAAVGIALRF